MRSVLDSWAVLAWLQAEYPARQRVRALLKAAEAGRIELFLSLINAGEIYYLLAKRHGEEQAEAFLADLPTMPIQTLLPAPRTIVGAARWKSRFRISYADAFAVQTAQEQDAALVTGDPEFRILADEKVVRLDWIGRSR